MLNLSDIRSHAYANNMQNTQNLNIRIYNKSKLVLHFTNGEKR